LGNKQVIEKRPLGKTGIEVSVLGLGTVKIGRNTDVKYPANFQLPSDTQVTELLRKAQNLGVNLVDTAPAYGTSESRLGELLVCNRKDWVICSKVGETYSDGVSLFDFTPEAVQRSVARSLNNLRTDYLDVVLIHSDGNDLPLLTSAGTLDALLELKAKGMGRTVGLSGKTVAGAEPALERCDVIMATINPDFLEELEVVAEAARLGVGVLVKKALSSGHGNTEGLNFAARQPGVSSVVVGTINPEHLEANCRHMRSQ
jgi:aryl-alcohol dehydrogenase-like predicted oxidoreductase